MADTAFDNEGFLINLNDWSESMAEEIARNENIQLEEAHWEVIQLLRNFYQEFERSPNMRALINYMKRQLPAEHAKERANSIYLMKLFPESPAKRGSKIAGLPKPENCL